MKRVFVKAWIPVLTVALLFAVVWVASRSVGALAETRSVASHPRQSRTHLDHGTFFKEPLPDGPSVTRACRECHPQAAEQVMRTSHFLWLGEPVEVEGHQGQIQIGKRNLINNFCIGITGNWPSCTSCHAGYGWADESFKFDDRDNVDCLVCHERTGTYAKGDSGLPRPEVDLAAAAKSVGYPRRENCGVCHNFGGGGVGVKHGDLDNSLNHPDEADDVHMGRLDFLCIDCHTTTEHRIAGRSISVGVDDKGGIGCADCHEKEPHEEPRLNAHLNSVACETCHIPTFARTVPTKLRWDWSKVGDDSRTEDPHSYLKKKGEFEVGTDVVPQYFWFNGRSGRYLVGDVMDPGEVTPINYPLGNIDDPRARITPFKTHRAVQPFDEVNRQLLTPVTSGEGGLWHTFDWNEALRLGAEKTGLTYSGHYGFANTVMYWPLSHMVAPKQQALECEDCHGERSRLDWRALGYPFDPITAGGSR